MAKVKELSVLVDELRRCGETLADISTGLADLFSSPQGEALPTKTEEDKPKITLVDVRKILAEKSRNGYREEVKALITKYGANVLSEISEEHYPDLLKDAEAIGNG